MALLLLYSTSFELSTALLLEPFQKKARNQNRWNGCDSKIICPLPSLVLASTPTDINNPEEGFSSALDFRSGYHTILTRLRFSSNFHNFFRKFSDIFLLSPRVDNDGFDVRGCVLRALCFKRVCCVLLGFLLVLLLVEQSSQTSCDNEHRSASTPHEPCGNHQRRRCSP
eukprot:scaffold139863_cov36-Cyclotella_meneghiniana.AAC.1